MATIDKLFAGAIGNPLNSRGSDVAKAVNALIDTSVVIDLRLASIDSGKANTTHGHSLATPSTPGFLSGLDKQKLDSIANNASSNSSDSYLLSRSNHTGTQTISSVSGLQSLLDNKAPVAHTHSVATTTVSGFLSSADKVKIDSVSVNASYNSPDEVLLNRINHSGFQPISTVSGLQAALDSRALSVHSHELATTAVSGFLSSSDKQKLDSVAIGATNNSSDSFLLNRSNHSGGQAIATIIDLQDTLDGKSNTNHSHPVATVSLAGLLSPLDKQKLDSITAGASATNTSTFLLARANHTGTQDISTVLGLESALSSKQPMLIPGSNISIDPVTWVISSTGSGGGEGGTSDHNLLSNRNAANQHSIASITGLQGELNSRASEGHIHPDATPSIAGFMSSLDKAKLDGIATGATTNLSDAELLSRAAHTGVQSISTVSGLQAALDSKSSLLVSGTNIKTINGASILSSGNIDLGHSVNGLLKCNGVGVYSAAVAGVDYVTPSGSISGSAGSVLWSGVTSRPTTLAGYGITDSVPSSRTVNGLALNSNISLTAALVGARPDTWAPSFAQITSKPTSLAGFGIVDAVSSSGSQTISGVKTFTSKVVVGYSGTIGASLNIASQGSSDPSSLANGDIWHRSDLLFTRLGGTTRTLIHTGNPTSLAADMSQAEIEEGVSTTRRWLTALRVSQAIAAQAAPKAATQAAIDEAKAYAIIFGS